MAVRSFSCKKCNLSFDYDVGEIGFDGLLPSIEKSAICPHCGKEVRTSDVLFDFVMATQDIPADVLAAVDRLEGARSWEQRRTVLDSNSILLTREAEELLESNRDVMGSMGVGEDAKGAEQLLCLVRRCREVGIDRAFRELAMNPADRVKGDYHEACRRRGYDPTATDWNAFSSLTLPLLRELIAEERRSATIQGVPDPALDGKTDAEVIKERRSGRQKSPDEEIIAPLTHEMHRNVKLLKRSFPMEFHCGTMPTLSFDAHSERTTHGAVIFIHGGVISLIYSLLKVYSLTTPIMFHTSFDEGEDEPRVVDPVLTRADAAAAVAGILTGFLTRSPGPPPFGGQGGAVADVSISLSLSAIRFIIAHECGHILEGHLSECESTFRNTPLQCEMAKWLGKLDKSKLGAMLPQQLTANDAYRIAGSWDQEREADQNGLDLCVIPAWPMNNTMERFHDASTRLAGPFIFFAIDEFINNAVLHILGGVDTQEPVVDNHPPSARRAEVMRAWIHEISDNAQILLEKGVSFAQWLRGISEEVYQRMT